MTLSKTNCDSQRQTLQTVKLQTVVRLLHKTEKAMCFLPRRMEADLAAEWKTEATYKQRFLSSETHNQN